MLSQSLTVLKSAIAPSGNKLNYNKSIESYRGLCALLVVLAHGTVHTDLLFENFKWPAFVEYINAGYLSVLTFFCISGYVIGLSNNSLRKFEIGNYIKKRAVRLYPIYILSIFLCVLAVNQFPIPLIIKNLLFLQNSYGYFGYPVLPFVNYASWSLNFEVVYYLAFIGIIFIRPRFWILLVALLALSIGLKTTGSSTQFIAGYINGFYFWILGLIIAWNSKSRKEQIKPIALLSLLFLHICINHLGIGKIILNTMHINTFNNINWLFDLPFCLMIITTLTGYSNLLFKLNKIFCYSAPAIIFMYLLVSHRIFENERWWMCAIFWGLSLLFYFEKKISQYLLKKLLFFWEISYAIYILHVPIALLIKKYVFIGNHTTELFVKYLLWIALTILFSYLMEKIVQPKIRSFFFKNAKSDIALLQKA